MMDLTYSFPLRTWCGCLGISSIYPTFWKSPRHIFGRTSSSTCLKNLMRARQVLTTLPTCRSPRSQFSLVALSPASSRQSGRHICPRDSHMCLNWMHTTVAPSVRIRWVLLHILSHLHQINMESSSSLIWSCLYYGWNRLSFSAPSTQR